MDTLALAGLLAQTLAENGVGVWRPAGPPYTPAEVGICYRDLPDTPDQVIALFPYIEDDDPQTGLATRRIQIRARGLPGDVAGADRLADSIFTHIQRRPTPGIAVIQRMPGLTTALGADPKGRQERADSYLIVLDNPEATP